MGSHYPKLLLLKTPTSASEASVRSSATKERREERRSHPSRDCLNPESDDRNKIKEDKAKRRGVVNQLEEWLIMCISLACGIHSSNGSHQYFEALLMSFLSLNRSECPCLLATITLEQANAGVHVLAGTQEHSHLQVDLWQTQNDKRKRKYVYNSPACSYTHAQVQRRTHTLTTRTTMSYLHNRLGQCIACR